MDQKFNQMDIAYCKQHPERLINSLYCNKDCPYPSRLACIQCVKKYNKYEGFEDVLSVLNDPKAVIDNNIIPKGKYDQLNEQQKFLDKDPEELIRSLKEELLKFIEILLSDLKKKLTSEIAKVKLQMNDAFGFERLRQAFKDILKVDKYHESEEWKKFEGKVQDFVLQFESVKNEKLEQACFKLKSTSYFFQTQLLSDFKSGLSKNVELLSKKLERNDKFSEFSSSLCDYLYQFELIDRIRNMKEGCPKVTLLFKGSVHGLNGKTFQEKCSDKGPTIVICKSKSGYVFGGYTPCKWLPNNSGYQKDESKTSFVFSYTRKEIYPITTGDNAICCNSSYGPIFGSGHYIRIDLNFQDGNSNMDGKCYSNESYKIENPKTHLMGGEKPELVEMEVFLVE